eukprot:PhM_4_TR14194/c0_g1_i1/m.876
MEKGGEHQRRGTDAVHLCGDGSEVDGDAADARAGLASVRDLIVAEDVHTGRGGGEAQRHERVHVHLRRDRGDRGDADGFVILEASDGLEVDLPLTKNKPTQERHKEFDEEQTAIVELFLDGAKMEKNKLTRNRRTEPFGVTLHSRGIRLKLLRTLHGFKPSLRSRLMLNMIPLVSEFGAARGDSVHDDISGVERRWELHVVVRFEELADLGLRALVHSAATGREDQQLLQRVPDLDAGLVDDHAHGQLRAACNLDKCVAELEGCVRVEARGRLVQHHHQRGGDKLNTNARTFALTTADAARCFVANHNVSLGSESQRLDDSAAEIVSVACGPIGRESHLGAVISVLVHSQFVVQNVVLRDKADRGAVLGNVGVAVQ